MSDTSPKNQEALRHGFGLKRESRVPRVGELLWELRTPDGSVHRCELHDESKVGAGYEVTLAVDSELQFGKRCGSIEQAQYVAQVFKQDTWRAGGREA